MLMTLHLPKTGESLTNIADQLPSYKMVFVLEKVASLPSKEVSHKCALNSRSGSRL